MLNQQKSLSIPERFDLYIITLSLVVMSSPTNLLVRVCLRQQSLQDCLFIADFYYYF